MQIHINMPVMTHGIELNTSAIQGSLVPHSRSPCESSLQKSERFFPYNSRKMLIENTEMNQMWARYTAPAAANHGSSTGRFSRPPRKGGRARIPTGMPVRAAPHQAAFQGNIG